MSVLCVRVVCPQTAAGGVWFREHEEAAGNNIKLQSGSSREEDKLNVFSSNNLFYNVEFFCFILYVVVVVFIDYILF